MGDDAKREWEDRARGCLYGLAVGDAMGAAVEFQAPGSFPPVTGFRAGGPHGLSAGEWTDDTSMALALADSIAEAGWDLDDQAKRYLDWYRSGRYSVNGRCFDIGIQTRGALARFERTGDARLSGEPAESASGNGSIMRLAPVAIAYGGRFPDEIGILLDQAEESSLPTHASPICRSACRYLGLVLAALAGGVAREEVLDPAWPMLRHLGPLHPAVEAVVRGSFREKQPPAIRGGGYVVDSLEAALWAFHDARDFREAVLRAVNLGEDADTTGAACGQLAGACWGESGIPEAWREGLARKELLEAALGGLQAQPNTPTGAAPSRPLANAPDWTYWVDSGRFLAGCFPGSRHPAERAERLGQLLDVGIRVFVNLMQPDERNRAGEPFHDYTEEVRRLAAARGVRVRCLNLPIRDLSVPTPEGMERILDEVDAALGEAPVYLHCWGGVGRTGTVAACWLLRHGRAEGSNVLEVLARLRAMDRERGHRRSPETAEQVRFVADWAGRQT